MNNVSICKEGVSVGESPRDSALPGVESVLDSTLMEQVLRESCLNNPDSKIVGLEISYVRYKPATSCLIAYSFELTLPGTDETVGFV